MKSANNVIYYGVFGLSLKVLFLFANILRNFKKVI